MEVKVRCCSLTKPAADGSIIGETCARNYLQSKDYQLSVDGKLTKTDGSSRIIMKNQGTLLTNPNFTKGTDLIVQ